MAAMVTRWLQRHRPMRDPVTIQISGSNPLEMYRMPDRSHIWERGLKSLFLVVFTCVIHH